MVSRTATALLGLLASLALSALLWRAFGTPLVFLFIPFVPFLFRRGDDRSTGRTDKSCPDCGFATRDPDVEYCPYDGTRLRRAD
ncbi:MAG: hypothetical protein ABEJ67_03465 [Halanaeroarchaeum sp.]